jgi:hypothetical protein
VKRAPYWNNPADLLAWLDQLREVCRDLGEAGLDLTKPEHERQLGAAAAQEAIIMARLQLYEMLELAIVSLGAGPSGALN